MTNTIRLRWRGDRIWEDRQQISTSVISCWQSTGLGAKPAILGRLSTQMPDGLVHLLPPPGPLLLLPLSVGEFSGGLLRWATREHERMLPCSQRRSASTPQWQSVRRFHIVEAGVRHFRASMSERASGISTQLTPSTLSGVKASRYITSRNSHDI